MTLTDVFQPIRRRTKAAYLRLFASPNFLFGRGTRTILFPNGAREIWISNADGTAVFKVRASDGPAAFSLTVTAAVGTLTPDAHVLRRSDYVTEITPDAREITLAAYYPDAYSQAFRRWYACDATADGTRAEPFPTDLGLTPRTLTPEVL